MLYQGLKLLLQIFLYYYNIFGVKNSDLTLY